MPRVYHNGAAGTALLVAVPDISARAVLGRPLDPLCFDPVEAGLHVKINITLAREGL